MRLELTGRHIEITPALRRLVDAKLGRLDRILNDSAVSAQVVLVREKHVRRAEVTLHARGEKFLHAVGDAASWQASMTQVVGRISQQAQRVKGKWQERKRRSSRAGQTVGFRRQAPTSEPSLADRPRDRRPRMPRVLKTSRQTLKALSIEDAAREVDAQGGGLVVFRDTETSEIAVLYRTGSGELTLVETEP